ncbi:MAG: hypothetical protein QM486_07305 [Flavobacteriaceae bacterium]
MKTIYYKLIVLNLLFIGGIQLITAQTFEKKYHENFKVNKDVVISINTYYTDVVIETWNRNTVDVSATITVAGKDIKQEDADKYFKNWQFEALGNHQKVSIKGENSHFYAYLNRVTDRIPIPEMPPMPEIPEMPELAVMPELSIKNLDILDSFKVVAPRILDSFKIVAPRMLDSLLANTPRMLKALGNIKLDSLNFDFDAYKKDSSYLEKWQKKARKKHHLTYFQRTLIDTSKRKQDFETLKKDLEKAKVAVAKQRKEYVLQRKELLKNQTKMRLKQRDAAKKIRAVLVKRNRIKLKKTIYIKAPKGAKFNMKVSYGSVKFPK